MYTPLEQARTMLKKRWADKTLRLRVQEYVGSIPAYLRFKPRAVIARHVATPNHEMFRFSDAAKHTGLTPICAEFTTDRFYAGNPDKLRLAKMVFFHGRGRRGGDKISSLQVIGINDANGKPFRGISTLWEENFVTFHHELLASVLPELDTFDCSEWLHCMGGRPHLFWHRHLALFVCHGILFDNFHGQGHEARFTREIILPAFARVTRHFGVEPLIVPLLDIEREREPFWAWYPGDLEQETISRLQAATGPGSRFQASNIP